MLNTIIVKRSLRQWLTMVGAVILLAGVQAITYAQEPASKQVDGESEPSKKTSERNVSDRKNKIKTEFSGRLMFDFDQFNGLYNEGRSGSDYDLRRGRFAVESSLKDRWAAVIEFSFDGDVDNVIVEEANFSYHGWKATKLIIGKTKEPFGLERSTSSKYLSTIERSSATSAFSASKSNGLVFTSRGGKRHNWALGVFEASETAEGVDTWALTGRYTYSPLDKKRQVLHFGFSGSARDMSGDDYEVQQEVEVNFADELDYGPRVLLDSITRVGLESAWVNGPFSLQGEWFGQALTVDNPAEDDDATYSGYYVLASVFLTGESKPYKNGRFRRIKLKGSGGAWELVGRYSVLDAVDNNDGIKSETITLGLNYYAGKQVRFMGSLINTRLSGPDADGETSGDAFSLRAQYDF